MRRGALRLAGAAAIVSCLVPALAAPPRSGYDDLSPALQALQRDDTQNPAMLWLAEGERLWSAGPRPCASCHGTDARQALRGVALRYPAYDGATRAPITLGQRIEQCRVQRQGRPPQGPEGSERLPLELLAGHASRGLPLAPSGDPRLEAARSRGEALFRQPLGQLALSCAACHERLPGRKLAGSTIPEGHPTGYPIYRLEWQGIGSLQRRLRGCMTGVRAEPYAPDAPEWAELELFLVRRAEGLPVETPAVRP
jgi:sulfur-oxidizing protein SoxA